MTQSAPRSRFRWLAYQTILGLNMLLIVFLVNAFLAPGTFLEFASLLAILNQMLIYGLDFDDLGTVLALGEEWTITPEVKVHFL
jgi:hypothetical protein